MPIDLGGINGVGPGNHVIAVAISGLSSFGAFVDDINEILKWNNEKSDLIIRGDGWSRSPGTTTFHT